MPKIIHLVLGARPNFMKIAPIWRALCSQKKWTIKIVFTGQHFSKNMTTLFAREHKLPRPHFSLNCGGGSHAVTTGRIMMKYEKVLQKNMPDLVIVVGDVDSTLACALTAKKLGIRVGHVESGLRSGDMSMPEEINRILVDHISDFHWVTTRHAAFSLKKEGIKRETISFVGNTMADSLHFTLQHPVKIPEKQSPFGMVTLHRPHNVDSRDRFENIMKTLARIATKIPLIFPVHPRTMKKIKNPQKYLKKGLCLVPGQGHRSFICLLRKANFIITDSGGVQEEAAILGTPCAVLRSTTERPEILRRGVSQLCEVKNLEKFCEDHLLRKKSQTRKIPLWDGKASQRIFLSLIKTEGKKW